MSNNQKQRSATERLNDVEEAAMSIFQALDNMSRDLMLIKDAIKLLGNKVDSIVKAASTGQEINDQVISSLMVENNVAELKAKVDNLVAQKILVSELAVNAQSFVVIREVDDAGKVVNPRLQFTMSAVSPEVTEKLVGAQPGQTVKMKEGSLNVEILEVYSVQGAATPAEHVEPTPAAAAEADTSSETATS